MIAISANDLKKKGISILAGNDDAILTIRGQPSYVILNIKHYEALREAELEMAILQTKKEIQEGKFIKETAGKHVKRVSE